MAFISNKLMHYNQVVARLCRQSLQRLCYSSYNISLEKTSLFITNRQIIPKYFCTNIKKTESLDEFRNREEKKEEVYQKEHDQKQTPVEETDSQPDQVENIKREILKSALQFIPMHGFTKESIAKGAEMINYPSTAHGLFPNGGGMDLIQYFYSSCNKNLIEELKKEDKTSKITPKEYLKKAIQTRLLMLQPYLSSWPQALAIMSLPPNVPTSIANLLTLVDDICYHAGDRSVDFNWYIRRIGLAGIYKSTELYMLQDKSLNFENTWKFLDQRLDEASVAHKFLAKSEETSQNIQNTIVSVFSTARNILGNN